MTFRTPAELMASLLDARANRDIQRALSCYEADAMVMMEPGKGLTGLSAIQAFTAATLDAPIKFGARHIVEGEGIALHVCAWTLQNKEDGPPLKGRTTDVLRRQPNGEWLIAIDNAWGTGVLVEEC